MFGLRFSIASGLIAFALVGAVDRFPPKPSFPSPFGGSDTTGRFPPVTSGANPFLTDLVASWSTPTFTAATNVITAWANDALASCGATCDLSPTNSPTVTGGATGLGMNIASTAYLVANDNASLSIGSNVDFGFCGWLNVSALDSGYRYFVRKGSEYFMGYYRTATNISVFVYDSVSGSSVATTGAPGSTGRQLFCGWYTAADKKSHMSINNGTVYDAGVALSNGPLDSTATFGTGTGASQAVLGTHGPLWFYKGSIPPVSTIYNSGKGITASEAPTTNLICAWDFDDVSGTVSAVAGSGGADCNLTPTNSPTNVVGNVQTKDALGNTSLGANLVAASTQYLSVSPAVAFFEDGLSVTQCGWANTTTVAAGVVYISVFREGASNQDYLRIGRSAATTYVNMVVGGTTVNPAGTGTYVANSWHFVCATGEDLGTTFRVTPYFDAVPGTAATQTASFTTQNLGQAYIGSLAGANLWNGVIAAPALWSRALTSAEITTLYAAGAGDFYDWAWQLFLQDPARFAFRMMFKPWQVFSRDAQKRPYAGA